MTETYTKLYIVSIKNNIIILLSLTVSKMKPRRTLLRWLGFITAGFLKHLCLISNSPCFTTEAYFIINVWTASVSQQFVAILVKTIFRGK